MDETFRVKGGDSQDSRDFAAAVQAGEKSDAAYQIRLAAYRKLIIKHMEVVERRMSDVRKFTENNVRGINISMFVLDTNFECRGCPCPGHCMPADAFEVVGGRKVRKSEHSHEAIVHTLPDEMAKGIPITRKGRPKKNK